MERPQDITHRLHREATRLIILFHLIGLIGLSIAFFRPYFLVFVPWHLLIMLTVLVICHQPLNARFIIFAILIAAAGFTIEYTGIHYHWPFGDYQYAQTLGWKISGVPAIIGVNWFLLVYATAATLRRSRFQRATSRITVGAVILVLLDLLIEPAAIKLDYWRWAGNHIPLSNYISWFVISIIMLAIFEAFRFPKQSRIASVFLLTQFIFFLILNFSI